MGESKWIAISWWAHVAVYCSWHGMHAQVCSNRHHNVLHVLACWCKMYPFQNLVSSLFMLRDDFLNSCLIYMHKHYMAMQIDLHVHETIFCVVYMLGLETMNWLDLLLPHWRTSVLKGLYVISPNVWCSITPHLASHSSSLPPSFSPSLPHAPWHTFTGVARCLIWTSPILLTRARRSLQECWCSPL